MELAGNALEFVPVEIVVETVTSRDAKRNVETSFSRGLPRFHAMPGLGRAYGPVAIVGGGPSLARSLLELRSFAGPIISCGTVHDYLVEHFIVPQYHVDGEPDPDGVMVRWLQRPLAATTYLIASHCPASTFDALKDQTVRIWHLAVPEGENAPDFRGEPSIPGPHFIVGRAWPLAAVMGYRDIHFFGFDCSFPEDCEGQHAYDYDWTLEEPVGMTHGDKRFITTPGLMSQLQAFNEMRISGSDTFKITVHGDGMAATVCKS